MQVYTKPERQSLKTVLFFLALLFIAYLPVSSFLFFIKNDAFNGYFPPKFFMSEAIQAGQLPFWNPYINYGLPQYADMSASYWNPFTWLIAGITGYNAYSFTIEILLYIFLAGTGMYQLCRALPLSRYSSLAAGASYICCGYITAHLQHFNWLTGAAFLPWCLWAFRQLQHNPSGKNKLIAVLSFYLLISSSHPGIIIGSVYFFGAYLLYDFMVKRSKKETGFYKKYFQTNLSFLVLLLLLSLGMIISYSEIIPYMTRGIKPAAAASDLHPMSYQSWISAIFPMSTVKNHAFFQTDLTMRNGYFGLGTLIFFITGLFMKRSRNQNFFLITGFLFLLLSSAGLFKDLAYRFLPLVAYVRMSGEFALFAQFAFIIFAAIQLDKFFSSDTGNKVQVRTLHFLMFVCIAVLIVSLIFIFIRKDSILYQAGRLNSFSSLKEKLRFLINALSMYDCLFIQSVIQLFILSLFRKTILAFNHRLFLRVLVADMIIAALLNIAFTGVGQASVADVQKVLDRSPKGIPVPVLLDPRDITGISSADSGLVGNWSFYHKQIGPSSYAFYPVELIHTRRMYMDTSIVFRPWIYSSTPVNIKIKEYQTGKISLTVNSDSDDTVRIKQNNYPHWYYNDNSGWKEVIRADEYFIGAPLKKGNSTVIFEFRPTLIKYLLAFTAILFICIVATISVLHFKNTNFRSSS